MLNGRILDTGKILVPTLQWYISHTCNLTCTNCSNLNNFAITGHNTYDDAIAATWADKLHVNDFCIIGGEPFTNNGLNTWALGLRKHFTCRDFRIVTNGTLLKKFAQDIPNWIANGITIEMSLHSEAHFERALADIDEILQGNYKKVNKIELQQLGVMNHIACGYEDAILVDDFPAFVINYKTKFYTWGVRGVKDGVWQFYDSDRELAHSNCWHKDTPYIFEGKMYKCGTIVGAKGFAEKYNIRQRDRELIESYKPIDAMSNNLAEQIQELNYSIAQCTMCPNKSNTLEKIQLDKKKILP